LAGPSKKGENGWVNKSRERGRGLNGENFVKKERKKEKIGCTGIHKIRWNGGASDGGKAGGKDGGKMFPMPTGRALEEHLTN